MTCCSANNCKNRTEQGFRMYRFPSLKDKRYIKWLHNMRRGGNWKPSAHSRLCEKHFEQSQFETLREDGLVKLKPNAVPTLFDVPNPPPLIDPPPRKSVYKNISKKNPTVRVTNESQKLRGTAQKLTSGISATETTLDGSEQSHEPMSSSGLEDGDNLQETTTGTSTTTTVVVEENQKLREEVTKLQNERRFGNAQFSNKKIS